MRAVILGAGSESHFCDGIFEVRRDHSAVPTGRDLHVAENTGIRLLIESHRMKSRIYYHTWVRGVHNDEE